VIFTVEDHGMGIEADDRKHIFEPFYRGRDAVSQQIQGSGLGLNLVMRIRGSAWRQGQRHQRTRQRQHVYVVTTGRARSPARPSTLMRVCRLA
jgi:signal transduction histidine kinase